MLDNSIMQIIKERFALHLHGENILVEDKCVSNRTLFPLNSAQAKARIRNELRSKKIKLKRKELKDLLDEIEAEAFYINSLVYPKVRLQAVNNRVILDVCDDHNTRIILEDGEYKVVHQGDVTDFIRYATAEAMTLPSDEPNLDYLNEFVHVNPMQLLLLIGWITFGMTHAKGPNTSYPILILRSGQGSGKTTLCKMLIRIIDPRSFGVQKLTGKLDDLSTMIKTTHLVVFDNVRAFTNDLADTICQLSTGGTHRKRMLFSDSDEVTLDLQSLLIMNGIHGFIDQPDLQERCLTIQLGPISKEVRKTDAEIMHRFNKVMPDLMAGLLSLAAKALVHLTDVEVKHPSRMMGVSKWFAAVELAIKEVETEIFKDIPVGTLQKAYVDNLNQASLDNLYENELAAALLEFAKLHWDWEGTPTKLLRMLNEYFGDQVSRSKFWPKTPISLVKRLKPLTTSLESHGLTLTFSRSKERKVSIQYFQNDLTVGSKYDETDDF